MPAHYFVRAADPSNVHSVSGTAAAIRVLGGAGHRHPPGRNWAGGTGVAITPCGGNAALGRSFGFDLLARKSQTSMMPVPVPLHAFTASGLSPRSDYPNDRLLHKSS